MNILSKPACPLCNAPLREGSLDEVGQHFSMACPKIESPAPFA